MFSRNQLNRGTTGSNATLVVAFAKVRGQERPRSHYTLKSNILHVADNKKTR